MVKYRIIERNGFYYPQVKFGFFSRWKKIARHADKSEPFGYYSLPDWRHGKTADECRATIWDHKAYLVKITPEKEGKRRAIYKTRTKQVTFDLTSNGSHKMDEFITNLNRRGGRIIDTYHIRNGEVLNHFPMEIALLVEYRIPFWRRFN